ncbi:MAG: hypothetical protein A2252_05645 [Elusimicrobia bacterium RIFOXYA2_FULL_39_19]|nr:MAG: hypothetical protein A2252_05645 [Elusimicrobia bacterium RIFOXYA2_FULL_39_19]
MHYLKQLIILLVLVQPALYSQALIPDRKISVEESVSTALNNRKEMLIAQNEIDLALQKVNEAGSYIYPKIDMTFNYSHTNTNQWMTLPPTFGSMIIPRSTTGDYYLTRLSLWQHVYSGGVYTSNLKLSKSNMLRAQNQLKVINNEITFEVTQAYYDLLSVEEKLNAYTSVIASVEDIMRSNTAPNTSPGIIMKDILQDLLNENAFLKNKFEKDKLDFLRIIGLEFNTNIVLTGKFEPIPEAYDLNKLLAQAFQYRPEPKQTQLQEETDTLSVKLSQAARSPTITLGAHYEFPGEYLTFENKNWNATINMNFPIADGFASIYRTRQKSKQKDQNLLKRKDLEDAIQFEVRKSFLAYSFWLNEISERETQLENAENLLSTVNPSDAPSILQAYKSFLKYKLNYIDSVKEHLTSRAALEHAIGKTLVKE